MYAQVHHDDDAVLMEACRLSQENADWNAGMTPYDLVVCGWCHRPFNTDHGRRCPDCFPEDWRE